MGLGLKDHMAFDARLTLVVVPPNTNRCHCQSFAGQRIQLGRPNR
jgi:hypothetical protein